MTVSAIQTRYAGCLFRSRTEARWAVWLTALGIRWEYEAEGFSLPSGPYLPDFWLPDLRTWIEVKGDQPTSRERALLGELQSHTNARAIMAVGVPQLGAEQFEWGFMSGWRLALTNGPSPEFPVGEPCLVDENRHFRSVQIFSRPDRRPHDWDEWDDDSKNEVMESEWERDDRVQLHVPQRLIAAYESARSARFEHGERPA